MRRHLTWALFPLAAFLPCPSQAQTTVSLLSSINPTTFGQPPTFTATVMCPVTPTGTVTFLDGVLSLSSPVALNSGQAALGIILTVGSHTITAHYNGDPNCPAATSPALLQVVNAAPPPSNALDASLFETLLLYPQPGFTSAPDSVPAGTQLTGRISWVFKMVTSYAGASFANPTFTINSALTSQNGIAGAGIYNQSNEPSDFTVGTPYSTSAFPRTLTASILAPGTGFKGIWYGNDLVATNTPGFDSSRAVDTFTIPPGGGYQNITVTVTPRDARYSNPGLEFTKIQVAIQGNCQNIGGPPNPAVNVCSSNTGASWVVGGDPLHASPQVNTTYTFTAQLLVANPTAVPITSKPEVTIGMATAFPQNNTPTTGSVTITDPTLGSLGYSVADGPPQWRYGPVQNTYQVAYAAVDATATTIASDVNPSKPGQQVTFTARVVNVSSPTSSTNSTVQFYDGATLLGPGTPGNGGWVFTTSSLPAGTHSITAVAAPSWPGGTPSDSDTVNDAYAGSTSPPLLQQVGVLTTTTLVSSLNPSAYPQSATLTATVAGAGPAPTGTVTFTLASTGAPVSSAVPLVNGQASITLSTLPPATYKVTAVYSGDSNNAPSTGGPLAQTVSPAILTASVTAQDKVYDGGNSATITGCSLSGAVAGDTVSCSAASATFPSANAGANLTVTATGIALGGPSAAYYALASNTATTTAGIAPAAATVWLGNLLQIAGGAPRFVFATVVPAVCSPVAVTYNGSPLPPADPGSYAVVALILNPNCTGFPVFGTLILLDGKPGPG